MSTIHPKKLVIP